MKRLSRLAFRVVLAGILISSGVSWVKAQTPATPPATAPTATPPATPSATPQATPQATPEPAKDAAKESEEDRNPFAAVPAPPLAAGMTGSDTSDPRFKLTPGMENAGEASKGMKHLLLLKKPDAFQLGVTDPDDPKVKKTVEQLGIGNMAKMPKELQIVIAELAFSNSDLAFQGNHLFQGNFYGVNIYDIANPANAALLTSLVCPGGQGDVSVYRNLLFMSVEMPNGRLDCGVQGFPPEPPPTPEQQK
jgi:hypothetical protein